MIRRESHLFTGRDAGFVAMHAALASTIVDLVMIPEVSDLGLSEGVQQVLSFGLLSAWCLVRCVLPKEATVEPETNASKRTRPVTPD